MYLFVKFVKKNMSVYLLMEFYFTDQLKSVLVEIPWGARTGAPSYFNVTVLDADNTTSTVNDSSVHFAWQFENKVIIITKITSLKF